MLILHLVLQMTIPTATPTVKIMSQENTDGLKHDRPPCDPPVTKY